MHADVSSDIGAEMRPSSDDDGLASWLARYSKEVREVVHEFLPDLATGRLLALVAEPGMGKTVLARIVARRWRDAGASVCYLRFTGPVENDDFERLRVGVREACACPPGRSLVVLDGPVMPDPEGFAPVVELLGQALSHGVAVAIAIWPESAWVLESFDDRLVVNDDDLLVSEGLVPCWMPENATVTAREATEMTGGIPSLFADLGGPSASPALSQTAAAPSRLHLRHLLSSSLRASLSEDEARLRLSMVILGEGQLAKAVDVAGVADAALGRTCVARSPLFGVDEGEGTFRCVRVFDDGEVAGCLTALIAAAKGRYEVVSRAVRALAEQGRFERAASVARVLGGDAVARRLVLTWPFELVGVGEVGMVRRALAASGGKVGRADATGRRAAQAAVSWLEGDWPKLVRSLAEMPPAGQGRDGRLVSQTRAAVSALGVTRSLAAASRRGEGEDGEDDGSWDAVSRALLAHGEVVREALQGNFDHALQVALESSAQAGVDEGGMPLYRAIASTDLSLMQALVQEGGGRHVEAGRDLSSSGVVGPALRGLVRARALANDVVALAQGDDGRLEVVERAAASCERKGQAVLAAALLLACVVGDLAQGARVRAFVRCQRASELAGRGSATFLRRQASVVAAVIDACLGNEASGEVGGVPADLARPDDEVGPVEWLLAAVARGDGRVLAHAPSALRSTRLPLSWAHLLAALAKMGGSVAETLCNALPSRWRAQLSVLDGEGGGSGLFVAEGVGRTSARAGRAPSAGAAAAVRMGADLPPLRINLLGGFEVLRGEVQVPESAWKRRRARLLLALLVVSKGHSMSRAEAVAALWPDCDYVLGRDRLYVTLGALRRALGQSSSGPGYVEGADGRLWLNASLVTTDVDEFDEACDRALARVESDAVTVRRCLSARELYAGDLTIAGDATGTLQGRREEERRRFVDVMVAGAEASLRQGSASRAEWFARTARRADALREDVAEAELRALLAQGRVVEARGEYERYAQALIEATGLPPSGGMRRLMGETEQASPRDGRLSA